MHKKTFKSISMILLMTFIFVLGCTKVLAVETYGTGDYCFKFNFDPSGYPVTSVTVNGNPWADDDYVYYNNAVVYEIQILAGKKGNDFPAISTPGGFDEYGHIESIKNPNDNPNVTGDEYLFTINVDENMPLGAGGCYSFGVSINEGPEPGGEVQNGSDGNITINVSGSDIEYHYVEDKPNEPDAVRLKIAINSNDIEHDQIPFTFGNATFNGGVMPPNATGVSTTNPIEYHYNYDGSGVVNFFIMGASNIEYSKFEINGVDYESQTPHSKDAIYEHHIGRALQFWINNVPYNENGYSIVVEGSKISNEKLVGSFGWNYKKESESDYDPNEDSLFTHGSLEFVSVEYDGVVYDNVAAYNSSKYHGTGEIFEWHDGNRNYTDIREAWGEALVPYGAVLTIKVVPDPGYQLVSLTNSSTGFTTTNEVGVYKIEFNSTNMGNGADNFHLGARFEEVSNEVITNSTNVKAGNIDVSNSFENGTAILEVNNVASMAPERMESFEETAENGGYEIDSYVDMSLYNAIYKGGKKDNNDHYESWNTEVTDLNDKVTVTLELNQDMSRKELAVIHEVHEGNTILGYDLIEAQYDESNNAIIFETDGFSYYALVTKGNSQSQTEMATVTFNSTGGTEIDPVEIEKGSTVSVPQDPQNGNLVFGGWYEEEACENEFDFNTPVNDNKTLYAKWDEPAPELVPYTANENGNIIEFKDESGHQFHLYITDYLGMSDEELEEAGVPVDLFNQALEALRENTKQHGTMLSLYDITLEDENHDEIHELLSGKFIIKIKITPEMSEYNTFKLIFVEDDFSLGEVITLTKKNIDGVDYLVGELNHLSTYVLTGSKISNNTSNNPQTADNIYVWFGMLIISILGLSLGTFTATKLKKSKNR